MRSNQKTIPEQGNLMKIGRRVFLAGLVVTAGSGCNKIINRAQSPDDSALVRLREEKNDNTHYIGEICGIYGLNFAKVEGIGLATGLKGTGSSPKRSGQRENLLRELEANRNIDNAKKLLADKDTELVIMKGMLPPGIREGDNFDLEVIILGNSKATSIENGMILQTKMRPMARLGRGVKQGHVTALGRGRILVDALFESRQDDSNHKHGVVLGGGKALENRPLGLTIRTDNFSPKTTTVMARAINSRFTVVGDSGREGVAEPKTDKVVELVVPVNYRNNVGRYMAVVKNIAYSEPVSQRVERMEELDRQLGEPSTAGLASIRLEALGKDGIPALKRGLRHPDMEVRFHAAQALAYSGQPDGIDVLKKAVEIEPAFRWHALTALSSMDDVEAGVALASLMNQQSAETRYGAFRAMRARSPHDPLVSGDWLAGDFFLHEVPCEAEPMLHFSRTKRPEIVVFGDEQRVNDNFLHVESGLTIRSNGNGTVDISLFSTKYGQQKKVCSDRIGDVIRTLANMGFGYGQLLKMLREAKQSEMLDTRLVVNAVPKMGRSYTPGKSLDELPPEKSNKYVADPIPELFRTGDKHRPAIPRVEEDTVGANEAEIKAENKSPWSKMTNWIARGKEE